MSKSKLAGKALEDARTAELVGLVNKRGMYGRAFPIFHVKRLQGQKLSKPDFEVANGGVHIGSAKLGAPNEFLAFRTAQEYSVTIPLSVEVESRTLGEVFAVTYPSTKSEKYTVHVLARSGLHQEVGLVLDTLEEVADTIVKAVRGEYVEVLSRAEPAYEEAKRLLNYAAESLASAIVGVPVRDLESVFGGHGFFHSVLEAQLPSEERERTLCLGAAFLFVNQVLFYTFLSEKSRTEKNRYELLTFELAEHPEQIQALFDRVYERDYEPIYAVNITRFMKDQGAREACAGIVRSILAMTPKLDVPELAGQIFQTLIPFELRKPLGAHYTNPQAARLLARLALKNREATVLDPACGSGTLLIAAYRRLFSLNQNLNEAELHRSLVEERMTGIDAMAFSAHLAAVGLALQQPLNETNYIRIGRTDSTRLFPGDQVVPTEESLPSQLLQTKLGDHHEEKGRRAPTRGPVKLGRKEPSPFKMEQVALLIMNPPFTSWENMASEYRNSLRERYSHDFSNLIILRPSQQLFFLLLSERFVRMDGVLASVLPLTTFTVHAFHPWIKHFLSKWTVKYVVVGLARASFSEDTSLTECLVVAHKKAPHADSSFMMVGINKTPSDLTDRDIESIAEYSERPRDHSDEIALMRVFSQKLLAPESLTLAGLLLSLQPEYDVAITQLRSLYSQSKLPFIQFKQPFDEGVVNITGGIRTGEHLSFYGKRAMIACRSRDRMRGRTDRLVYLKKSGSKIVLKDIIGDKEFEFQASSIRPALRRFSFTGSIDVTNISDLCVFSPVSPLSSVMERMYGKTTSRRYLKRIGEISPKYPEGRWSGRVRASWGEVCLMRRLDLAAPNTTVLCVWSREPLLPACEGYAIQRTTPVVGKLLTMWYNSTPFIILALSHSTLTRGTWLKLEDFAVKLLPIPEFSKLTNEQSAEVEEVFQRAGSSSWPTLMEQLRTNAEGRRLIDSLVLRLFGIESENERKRLMVIFRLGALKALEALLRTMVDAGPVDDDGEDEEEDDDE